METAGSNLSNWPYAKFEKAKANRIYKVKVRSYITINEQRLYGAYSKYIYVVPQPSAKVTKKLQNSVNIKWSKVQYQIYAKISTDDKGKYKKVATVKKGKTSYKFTRMKGKKIDTWKNYCDIKVVAVGKFGSKKVKSYDEAALREHLGL